MINYLASITDSSVSGKIAIINNTTNRPNFNNKIAWLYHWGNVDDENNNLHITYYSTPIAGIEIKGSQYIYSTGEHTFYCKPNTTNGNDVVDIRWSLDTNLYAKIVRTEKDYCVINVSQLGDEDTLAPQATLRCYMTKTNGEVLEATWDIGLYPRRAHLGDYVFYDGTYGPTTSGKTIVGICFYINPTDANDRRMIALSNLENSGIVWGLYPNENSGVYPIELQDDVNYSVYDISSISNITQTGLQAVEYDDAGHTSANYIRPGNYIDENTVDGFINSDVKIAAVGDGIAAPGTTNTGKDTLSPELALLSGAYKKGDEVPVGLVKTLKIIQHRNKILEDSGVNLPIPEATESYTEQAMLTQYINDVIANNENLSKYQQFYYPAVSKCYAYQPVVKADEELADKFKYHNWYLPSVGELMRMYWHARQGVNYDDDKIGAIFQKALNDGVFNDFSNSWYWSSSEYSQLGSWFVYFSNGGFNNNFKNYSNMVRAVAAF